MHMKWDSDGDDVPKTKLALNEWIKFENIGVFGNLVANPFFENVGYIHGSVIQALYDYKRGISMVYGPNLSFQSKNFNGELTETLQSVIPGGFSNVQEYLDDLEKNLGMTGLDPDDYYKLLPEERVGYYEIEWEDKNDEWVEKLGVFDAAPRLSRSTIGEGTNQESIFFPRGISFDSLEGPKKLFSALASSIGLTDEEFNTDNLPTFRSILEKKFNGIILDDDHYTRIDL